MDKTDRKILSILQKDGRVTNQELADAVALTPPPCLRRVKQLEEDGYINKYVALLEPSKLGWGLSVYVLVTLKEHSPEVLNDFKTAIAKVPQIVECSLIAGQQADYMLKVIASDMSDYQGVLLSKLTSIKSVGNVQSIFILETLHSSTELPL